MQCSRLMILIVLLPVLLSSLEIQLAEGIKCYTCRGCMGKGGEEKDCEETYDRCVETMDWMTASNKTQTARFCSDEKYESGSNKLGWTCDMFRPKVAGSTTLVKQCFCYTDLCNDMIPVPTLATTTTAEVSSTQATNDASLITGFSTLLQPLIVFCSTFFLFKGFFQ